MTASDAKRLQIKFLSVCFCSFHVKLRLHLLHCRLLLSIFTQFHLYFLILHPQRLFLLRLAPSCCLQIPYNSEEIRRALIAVHNFAVPQIKVLSSFLLHSTFSPLLWFLSGWFIPLHATSASIASEKIYITKRATQKMHIYCVSLSINRSTANICALYVC